MKAITSKIIAGVKLFEIEVSEDELDVYERCMKFVYNNLSPEEAERITGAFPDELLSICEQLTDLLHNQTDLHKNSWFSHF